MPAVAFLGSIGSGHGCFPPRPSVSGDPTFRINGIPVHRAGDAWGPHSCGLVTHDGVLAAGSPTFRVNGQPAGRIADPVDCGSVCAQGDPTFRVSD